MLSPLLLPLVDSPNSYNKPVASRRLRYPPAMSLYPSAKGPSVDDVVHRLQGLSIPSRPQSPSQSSPSISFHPSSPSIYNTPGQGIFESSFTYSWPGYRKESQDDLPTIIDTFAPRRPSFDLSPTSSASSDLDSSMPYYSGRSVFDAFFATQSRVVRVSVPSPLSLPFLTFLRHSYPICPLLHVHSSLLFSFKMCVQLLWR
jgi:hypothetical protein